MDDSTVISAVQSLNGGTPKEKFKNLHGIITEMTKDREECENFLKSGLTNRVRPGLVPYLHVLVGEKLRKNDAIIAALKSDDVTIIKRALRSKFFFNVSNPILNPEYFVTNIIPNISQRTRRELIKTLARHLDKNPSLADEFFKKFSPLVGINETLPLIISCSEEYIESLIHNRLGIFLPNRILRILFRKHPQLIIRQLKSNKQWRIVYLKFLPELIKNYIEEFVELHKQVCVSDSSVPMFPVGSTRAKSFLKNASELIVDKPEFFFDIIPLKLLTYKLGFQNFEKMFKNLVPKKFVDGNPNFVMMSDFLKYYPEDKRILLIKEVSESFYQKDFYDVKGILDEPKLYNFISDACEKQNIGKKILASFESKSEQDDHLYYLPPNESIPKLKEMINKTSEKPRSHWINQMITSCSIYNDKTELLNVLKYYNARHKNERLSILESVLETLTWKFDVVSLDQEHIKEIMVIIQRAHVKGDFFNFSTYLYLNILKSLLSYYFQRIDNLSCEDEDNVDLLVSIAIEGSLEYKKMFGFSKFLGCPKFSKKCTVKFLIMMEKNYNEHHKVWNDLNNFLGVPHALLFAVHKQYLKNKPTVSSVNHSEDDENLWNLGQKNLHQLKNFAKSLLEMDLSFYDQFYKKIMTKFRELVRNHDPVSYQYWIDNNYSRVNNVETMDALLLLKRDHSKVQHKCKQYLDACRKSLSCRKSFKTFSNSDKFARRFVAATKWYENISVEFVCRCLKEIEVDGSIMVLGILLEGARFKYVAKSFSTDNIVLDVRDDYSKEIYQSIKHLNKAINYTNPPIPLDAVVSFCRGDHVALIRQSLINIGRRTRLNDVYKFVDQLLEKPIAVRKVGLQLVFEVATKSKLQEFLVLRWQKEDNKSIREIMVKMILDLFKQTPNDENWQLVISSIDALTVDDAVILDLMINSLRVINESYLQQYLIRLIIKINSFPENEIDKLQLINSYIKNADDSIQKLPDDLLDDVAKKYLFNLNVYVVLYKYLSPNADKLDHRLKKFLEIVDCEVKNYQQPDEKLPRFYRTKHMLEDFVQKLRAALLQKKHSASLQIVQGLLSLFESRFKPCEFPHIYVQLYLLGQFFESEVEITPRMFGVRCGKKLAQMINQISSDCFFNFIAMSLYQVLVLKGYEKPKEKLDLIEGLMESDDYYGSLIGMYVIRTQFDINQFDDRYDKLIKIWSENENPIVKAVLNECLKPINDGFYNCNKRV